MYREIIQAVMSEVVKYADIKESTSEETNVGFIVTFYDEIEADEMRTRLMQDIAASWHLVDVCKSCFVSRIVHE